MERLYPSRFLKSDGNQATPHCAPSACPMRLITCASLCGLTVSVPIFNNRQTKSSVQKAKLQYTYSQLELTAAKKDLYKTIEGIWLDAYSAQQQFTAAQDNVRSTEISYSLVNEQFGLGMKNTVELLTEKNNYLSAQQQLLQAKYMAILNTKLLQFYAEGTITME